MWLLWNGDGYGLFYSVPIFMIWVVWHGIVSDIQRKKQSKRWFHSEYLAEIVFRIFSELGFLTIFSWLVSNNPPFWDSANTVNTIPLQWFEITIAKHIVNGFILLFIIKLVLQNKFIRKIFDVKKHVITGNSIIIASFIIAMLLIITDAIGWTFFSEYNDFNFIENLFNSNRKQIYTRSTFLLICFASGVVFAALYNKNIKLIQEKNKEHILMKSLIDSIPDLIFYKDINSVYMGCNKAFEEFTGKPEYKIINKTDYELFDKKTADLFRTMDKAMLKESAARRNEELVPYPDGTEVYLDTLKTPYYDHSGNSIGLIGISRNITEAKKRQSEIEYLLYHDVLTDLYNRNYYHKEHDRIISPESMPLSIIICDINGMKIANDAFGHKEGDRVLKGFADSLRQGTRSNDILFRFGGDEFLILLPNTNAETVEKVAENIETIFAQKIKQQDFIYSSAALGFATQNNMNTTFNKTFKIAEDWMYRRKLFERKSAHNSFISSIKTTMYEKSNETQEHTERIAELSKKLGKLAGLSASDLDDLELAALLHDIGKISVDKNILTKKEKLSEDDWNEIKKHPEVGYRIASASKNLSHIADYILSHHERWDGKGYPQGLSGENIPLLARIICIADSYDAMTNDRAYRKALSKPDARKEILDNAGAQFDPFLAKLFVEKVIDL